MEKATSQSSNKRHYMTNHALTSSDLYRIYRKKKAFLGYNTRKYKYKADTTRDFCAKVFNYCLYLIILDIINNNIIFALPNVFGNDSEIAMKVFEDEEFKRLWHKGKFDDIDYIMSGFKGYQIFFNYEHKGIVKEKPIYINYKLKDMITQKVNSGKTYY